MILSESGATLWEGRVRENLQEVLAARKHQLDKWGLQSWPPDRWMSILGEEFGEAARATMERGFANTKDEAAKRTQHLKHELFQVAAVAIAYAQYLDRGEA